MTARARRTPLPAGSACTHRVPAGSGLVRSRTPSALRSSATRDRIGRPGATRADASLGRPPAPKARSGRIATCDDREWPRSRPLWCCPWLSASTGRDRCEWHGSGTADDVRRARKSRHQLDRTVRPDPGDTRLVGKGRRRLAAAGRWDSKPPPRWPGDRGQEREGAATRDGRLARVARRAYGLHVRAHAHSAGDAGRPRAISWPRRRQLPLQTSEPRQARPLGAATVPGRG
jgi:hypothetical protein